MENVSPRVGSKRKPSVHRGQSQSCHQCRQSIFSAKGMQEAKEGKTRTKCSNCTRYWCWNCLQNRYGISTPGADKRWQCPFCQKKCNCSLCRKKAGQLATGILTPLAKTSGFGSVSEYLTNSKDEIAACLQWTSEKDSAVPSAKRSKVIVKQKSSPRKQVKRSATPKKSPRRRKKTAIPRRISTVSTRSSVGSSSEVEPISPRRGSGRWSLRPQPRAVQSFQHSGSYESCSESSSEEEMRDPSQPATPGTIPSQTQSSTVISTVVESRDKVSSEGDSDSESDDHMRQQLQLSHLKRKWKDDKTQQKMETLHESRDGRKQQRLRQQQARAEQVRKERELKKQERLEVRISKQDQLRRLILEKREARLQEKHAKGEQLKKLKEQKREEKKRIATAVNVYLSDALPFVPNSPKDMEAFVDLPVLPSFSDQIEYDVVSQSLQVWCFLLQFKEVLKCTVPDTFEDFACSLRSKGGGPIDLYCSLLKLLLEEDDPNRSVVEQTMLPLSRGVCNRILREFVAACVEETDGADSDLLNAMPPKSAADHANVASFLVGRLLLLDTVSEAILKAASDLRAMRSDLRVWQKTKTKEISDRLMDMNNQQCTVEELTGEREERLNVVADERKKLLLQQQEARHRLRVSPLGQDRHGRLYWSVPAVPQVLVEDLQQKQWLQIATKEFVDEVMACLDVNDEHEMALLSSLSLLPCT